MRILSSLGLAGVCFELRNECPNGLQAARLENRLFCHSCETLSFSTGNNTFLCNDSTGDVLNFARNVVPQCGFPSIGELPEERPVACISPSTSCDFGTQSVFLQNRRICHNCDDAQLDSFGRLRCIKQSRARNFEPSLLRSCLQLEPTLAEEQPLVCRPLNGCPAGSSSIRNQPRDMCFNCDTLRVSGNDLTCTKDGNSTDYSANVLPACTGAPVEIEDLRRQEPVACRSVSACPLGGASLSLVNGGVCHNCDSIQRAEVPNTLVCTRDGATRTFNTQILPTCNVFSPPRPEVWDAESGIACRTGSTCDAGISSMFVGTTRVCHTCTQVSVDGLVISCDATIPRSYNTSLLPSCTAIRNRGPLLGTVGICEASQQSFCPAGASSVVLQGKAICFNCNGTNATLDSDGTSFSCPLDENTPQTGFAIAKDLVPDCTSTVTLQQPAEPAACRTNVQCPIGVPSAAVGTVRFCHNCNEVFQLQDNSITCGGTQISFSQMEACYPAPSVPQLAEKGGEVGACLGDIVCPAGSQKIDRDPFAICHNCETASLLQSETDGPTTLSCSSSAGGAARTFQFLPRCGNFIGPFASLSKSQPALVCSPPNRRGDCPLLSQALLLAGNNALCHNCDSARLSSDGLQVECIKDGKTTPFDVRPAQCSPQSTADPSTPTTPTTSQPSGSSATTLTPVLFLTALFHALGAHIQK